MQEVPGTLCAKNSGPWTSKKEVILKPSQAMSSIEKVRSTSEQTLCKRHETWEEERSIIYFLGTSLEKKPAHEEKEIDVLKLDQASH